MEWGLRDLQKRYERIHDSVSTIKQITESVREVINAREEKLSDAEVLELIEEFVLHDSMTAIYPYKEKRNIIQGAFNATRKELGILQPYADYGDVSEIMVNGLDGIFIERKGKIERIDQKFDNYEELEEIIRRLVAKVHKEINELNPIVDARMEDGSRIHAVYKNVALNGPILSIRKFPEKRIAMEELLDLGTITKECASFLECLVKAGYNIFISGGTSSGKTTFLNVLSNYIPKDEGVIVIEDSAELQITGVENIVRMESKQANMQGKGEVSIRQLIKASLRMRPDRIIVGEVRGAEVLDMVQAMNTGHDGSLSTGHGNSPEGMLTRLEAMFLTASDFPVEAVRNQISEAIDIIVHMARMPDKSRKVLEVVEIEGYKDGEFIINPLFSYKMGKGLESTGRNLKNVAKLKMKGIELK